MERDAVPKGRQAPVDVRGQRRVIERAGVAQQREVRRDAGRAVHVLPLVDILRENLDVRRPVDLRRRYSGCDGISATGPARVVWRHQWRAERVRLVVHPPAGFAVASVVTGSP